MQMRYRWFRIQLPIRARNLASLLATCPFEPASENGFSKAPDAGTPHRFLWRSRVVVTKLDTDGTPTYEQIDSVSFTDFAILELEELVFLRVENPGRNIRDLLNALETLVGIGFTAKSVTFEKERPSTVFSSVDSSRLVGLKIIGAVLADDLVARMEFASKEGMEVDRMAILDRLKYQVDLAVFEIFFAGLKGQVSFASNGTVKISGQLAPKLIGLIEQDLPLFM